MEPPAFRHGEIQTSRLAELLALAWCRDASADPNKWTAENPAWGQCAVTALLVQDTLGGELVVTPVKLPGGVWASHYLNQLPSGEYLDLTRQQFPADALFSSEPPAPRTQGFSSTREYVLSVWATRERYEALTVRFEAFERALQRNARMGPSWPHR